MNAEVEFLLKIVYLLLALDVVVLLNLLFGRTKNRRDYSFTDEQRDILLNNTCVHQDKKNYKDSFNTIEYLRIKDSIILDKSRTESIESLVKIEKIERKYIRRIKSVFKAVRIESAVYLGLLRTEKSREVLEKAIKKEKNYVVKLYIANALADIGKKESIPVLVSTLINSHRFYRDKVNMLIAEFGDEFNSYIPKLDSRKSIELKELIVDFSSVYFSETVKQYLMGLIDNREIDLSFLIKNYENNKLLGIKNPPASINIKENYQNLVYKACEILAENYPQHLLHDRYLYSEDINIRNIAIRAMANYNSEGRIEKLLSFISDEETARSAAYAISLIIEKNPGYIDFVSLKFHEEKNLKPRQHLAKVLSNKIEFFIMKLNEKNNGFASEIIKEIIISGRNSEIIDFLNKNKNIDIENELITILRDALHEAPEMKQPFAVYLSERIARKSGITPIKIVEPKREEKMDIKQIRLMYALLAICILVFPAIYFYRHNDIIQTMPLIEQIKIYVVDFNYYLAYYSIAISSIYLILLMLSFFAARRQSRLWATKFKSFLFKKRMLPSVSVIAPAYNEAKTIIESTNSLLNLKYPDYELIIVNDGSKDNTLDVLIQYFNLVRVDYIFTYRLNTKKIRGVYINRLFPRLIVVDKYNGGKADSLNAGINISNKEYFSAIDSDSLLEDEALLKLASLTLDERTETPALGGNIFPINGCVIEKGVIERVQIPKKTVAKVQTIEYMRAFMAGRLGWSQINSLMIISGAFGLFRKERVISVGGYLTNSGKYAKDTVGEDMELVVRISRLMREMGNKFRICYAYNANCWTEVPEDINTLKKQRYRWQKGLIDIILFHKRMVFNIKYGRTGIIAMPYFFLFEMMGPLIETQGYIMVILAFFLGLLNQKVALILFTTTVLMGVLISICSLLIAQKDIRYFKFRDQLELVLFAILENFGMRQLFSFWRVGAYFSMLWRPVSWDKADRKGFSELGSKEINSE